MAVTAPVGVRRQVRIARVSMAHIAMAAAALLGGGLTFHLLTTADARTEVAVLTRAIPAGSSVTESQVRWEPIRADDGAGNLFLTRDTFTNLRSKVTAHALSANSILAPGDFLPRATEQDGLAAVSISVSRSGALGGALRRGDRVDIVAEAAPLGRVADNVEVIDIDTGESGPLGGGSDDVLVTLAVSRELAVSIAQVSRAGEVDLIRTTGLGDAAPLKAVPFADDTENEVDAAIADLSEEESTQ